MANILIGHVKGPKGDAATVSVGTTTTGAAGSSASVTNSGTSSAAVLNFTIPKGDKGDAGTPGVTDYATSSAAGLVRVGSDFNINSSNGTLSIDKTALLEDGLTSTSTSKALTAKQGKALNDAKLAKTSVVNNLTTTESGYALDAREGKALNDAINTKLPSSLVYNNNNVRIQRAGNLYFASSNGATAANFKAAFAQYYTQGGGVFRTLMYDFTLKDFIVVTATNGSSDLGMFAVTGWGSQAQVADADVIQGEMFWGV